MVGGVEVPARLLERGRHLEQRRRLGRPTDDEPGTEHVPGPRHRTQIGPRGHRVPRGLQVVRGDEVGHETRQRRRHRLVGFDDLGQPPGARWGCGHSPVRHRHAGDDHAGAPGAVGLQPVERRHGVVQRVERDRLGGDAEAGGDGRLPARLHPKQRGHGAENATDRIAGGEDRAGAVLAGGRELQRLDPGDQPGPVAFPGALRVGMHRELVLHPRQRGHGLLVLAVEPFLAGVEAGDQGLGGRERVARVARGGRCAVVCCSQPGQLDLASADPFGDGLDLAGEPRQSFPPVGRCPQQARYPAVLGGVPSFRAVTLVDHGVERAPKPFQFLVQRGFGEGGAVGVGVELLGITARPNAGVSAIDLTLAGSFGGQAADATQPLGHGGQAEEQVGGGGQGRGVGPGEVFELGLSGRDVPQRRLHPGALVPCELLGRTVAFELSGQPGQVVGEQPESSVPDRRLDARRPSRDLCLPPERLQGTPELGQQVGQAVEVRLGGVELPERLLLDVCGA